MSFVQMLKLR